MSDLIQVIVGSTRTARVGKAVADWVYASAKEQGLNVELIDLAEVNLPWFDEEKSPMMGEYQLESTKQWAATVGRAAGFIFVTPEYNGFPPAPLKNALDTVSAEWNDKPGAVVSYGAGGGNRSAKALKELLGNLEIKVTENHAEIKAPWDNLTDGTFTPKAETQEALGAIVEELKN